MTAPVVPVVDLETQVDLDRIRRALAYLDALVAQHPELKGERSRARLAEALGSEQGTRVSWCLPQ